jgi:antitoxin component of MazEF toxin-antitoxin module
MKQKSMQVKVQQVGNSIMVAIPKPLQRFLGLTKGDIVDLDQEGRGIKLTPVRRSVNKLSDLAGGFVIKDLDIREAIKVAKESGYDRV